MSNLGTAPVEIAEVVESEAPAVVDADFATVVLGAPKNEVMEALCVVFVLFTTPEPLEEERASAALRLSEEAMANVTRALWF